MSRSRVATDDRRVLDGQRADRLAVHEHVVRRHAQPGKGAAHGENGGVVNVDPVDLAHGRGAQPDGRRPAQDLLGETFALGRGQSLRVADTGDGLLVERHRQGAGHDGAGRRSDADLVEAEDHAEAMLARQSQLEAARRRDHGHCREG
jgi:hypothetical protein